MQPKVKEAGATVIREVVGLVPYACSAQLLPYTRYSAPALPRTRTKGVRLMKTDPLYSLLLKEEDTDLPNASLIKTR